MEPRFPGTPQLERRELSMPIPCDPNATKESQSWREGIWYAPDSETKEHPPVIRTKIKWLVLYVLLLGWLVLAIQLCKPDPETIKTVDYPGFMESYFDDSPSLKADAIRFCPGFFRAYNDAKILEGHDKAIYGIAVTYGVSVESANNAVIGCRVFWWEYPEYFGDFEEFIPQD